MSDTLFFCLFFVQLVKPVCHLWGESHVILSIAFGYYSSKKIERKEDTETAPK